jgi:hypothetical protein
MIDDLFDLDLIGTGLRRGCLNLHVFEGWDIGYVARFSRSVAWRFDRLEI